MAEFWETIVDLGFNLWKVTELLGGFALRWSLLIAWVSWWLWGVNWKKAWPVLSQGAWAPVVLIVALSALVWSQISPSKYQFLGIVTVANFWWQLSAVSLLAGLTFFCGWLQGVFGWEPAEECLEPAAGHAHCHHGDHDHEHAHDNHHHHEYEHGHEHHDHSQEHEHDHDHGHHGHEH